MYMQKQLKSSFFTCNQVQMTDHVPRRCATANIERIQRRGKARPSWWDCGTEHVDYKLSRRLMMMMTMMMAGGWWYRITRVSSVYDNVIRPRCVDRC